MVITAPLSTFLLAALVFQCEALTNDYKANPEIGSYPIEEIARLGPSMAKQEYIREIHSMMNAYKADLLGERMVIETNALIDTKYKESKRNADLINSILALPKGMNDAGR